MLLGRTDQFGKLGWLTVTVVAFWLAWPVGLMVVAYLVGSGRIRNWRSEMSSDVHRFDFGGMARRGWSSFKTGSGSSGNSAFDDYRQRTLSELEAEQREFQVFLEQLRAARDKAEFDAFMAQRRNRPSEADPA